MYIYIYIYVCVCVCVCRCSDIRLRCIYVHIHIHTHTCAWLYRHPPTTTSTSAPCLLLQGFSVLLYPGSGPTSLVLTQPQPPPDVPPHHLPIHRRLHSRLVVAVRAQRLAQHAGVEEAIYTEKCISIREKRKGDKECARWRVVRGGGVGRCCVWGMMLQV